MIIELDRDQVAMIETLLYAAQRIETAKLDRTQRSLIVRTLIDLEDAWDASVTTE